MVRVVILTKFGSWEAGSIFKVIVKILYCYRNFNIVSYLKNFKVANSYREISCK